MPIIGSGRVVGRSIISGNSNQSSPPRAKKKVSKLRLDGQASVNDFVNATYDEVMSKWNQRQEKVCLENLRESRDAVLASLKDSMSPKEKIYPRLLSNEDDSPQLLQSLYCQICDSQPIETVGDKAESSSTTSSNEENVSGRIHASDAVVSTDEDLSLDEQDFDNNIDRKFSESNQESDSFKVKIRFDKKYRTVSVGPSLYLEGTHSPRPSSSATIFLKTHYATEDEQNLKYVPYFGDDDKDDVVSDLYNLEDRQKQMEFGAEYLERNTNDILDAVLRLIHKRLDENQIETSTSLNRKIHESLALTMDEYLDRVIERYELVISKTRSPPSQHTAKPLKHERKMTTYSDAMDTYRPIFCRRCFIYDCNMHGNLSKASLELQGELAIQKERDGYWNHVDESNASSLTAPSDDASKDSSSPLSSDENSSHTNEEAKPAEKNAPASKSESIIGNADISFRKRKPVGELTQIQKAVCERMFLIFQGDTEKMAVTMQAAEDDVVQYCREQGFELKDFKHLKEEHIQMFSAKKRKKGPGNFWQSMNNYNPVWLKRVEDSEIRPVFVPCDHEDPCSEESCSCVRNAFFCTKHCAWERRSRNFFRGCNCNGRCTTKSCSCFAAKRECDPDLCKSCGACTDPPNQPATAQRCRNDQIGMRRHCHLLLAKSQIEDAGWGIYTRYPLKKGDYVHEYVGEVISQEEAERRGRIYDKVNRSYLFNLSSDFVVDASRKGNKTRFANHSSKPNCYTKMVNVNGDVRIGLFAKEDIEAQTELFFDYRYDVGIDNELIVKPGMTVDWMKNPKMANKISKKYA
jgi:SET domain/CXC domain